MVEPGTIRAGVSGRTIDRHVGGNTTYVRRVYEALGRLGVRHEVLRPTDARATTRAGSARYAAFEALPAQLVGRRQRLDLVHFPADTGPLVRVPGCRVVVTIHGVAQLHERNIRSSVAGRVWLERTRRAARVADLVITVSESSADDVRRLAGDSKALWIEVIHHGIDAETFRPATQAEIAGAHRRLGINGPFVLYVGNLEPRKNIIELVRAMELVRRAGERIELIVVGRTAWGFKRTLRAIDASPHARRAGWLSDEEVRALMSSCAAFAFPSRYEGFGLPVLEAMACGAPVVCSRRGSLAEVAGGAATYTNGVGAEDIADGILRALASDRVAVAERSRARAAQFTWSRSAERHRAAFQALLER